MSNFSGTRLRQIRMARRMSLSDVNRATGISRSQISEIENLKVDPRISTVIELLRCYGAGLADLESRQPAVRGLDQVLETAAAGARRLAKVGLGPSDVEARLARKESRDVDISAEHVALSTR